MTAFGLGRATPGYTAEKPEAGLAYKAEIEGIEDGELKDLIISVSDVFGLQNSPPASLSLLNLRMNRDVPVFLKALNSFGYFKAEVQTRIDDQARPLKVIFQVKTGPRFTFSTIDIKPDSGAVVTGIELPRPAEIGLEPGRVYRAEEILIAQRRLLNIMSRRGFPFPKIIDRRIVADHATDNVSVEFHVKPGPRAVFGQVKITGLSSVKEKSVIRLVPWTKEQVFDAALLEQGKHALMESGLFSVVEVKLGELGQGDELPILLHLTERKHRTIRVGLGYQTDTGFEGRLGWAHRNLFGSGETLSLDLSGNEINRSFEAAFRRPWFLAANQTLL
ncbi:MAG: POTRA domain-containing protein, partial [Pseudomonadota bacterium]